MKGKKLFPVFLIFPLLLSLCGFSFYIVSVLVDTEQNHVYEYATADEILNDFAKDIVAAEAEYKGGYYYVSGKTVSISKTGDILKEWDRKQITQTIYDNYWGYHTERLENAFADIDGMLQA